MSFPSPVLMLGMAAALWICNGDVSAPHGNSIATAEAVVGAPVTPVSYAGVARRSTVGAGRRASVPHLLPGSESGRRALVRPLRPESIPRRTVAGPRIGWAVAE